MWAAQILAAMSDAIAELHRSPRKVVIATTGGGAGLQNQLWVPSGASATLLESSMPYDPQAMIDFIGHEPEKYCAEATALWMASAAHRRARELVLRGGGDARHAIGLGLTAALATDRARKGAERVFVATRAGTGMQAASLTFVKGQLDRQAQGALCDFLGIDAILHAAGIESPFPQETLFGSADREYAGIRAIPSLDAGQPLHERPLFLPDGSRGERKDLDSAKHILYPGSFDPLHFGHEQSAAQAERMTGKQVVYAITNTHPDKGLIPDHVLLRRAEQFRWRAPVLFTAAEQYYISKARAFPGFGMLVGTDAVLGMLNPRYYGSDATRDEILREMLRLGTRFYVAGREVDGRFMTLEDIPIPAGFEKLFVPLSGRWDVRSRDLR